MFKLTKAWIRCGKCISVWLVHISTEFFDCKEMIWLKLLTVAGLQFAEWHLGFEWYERRSALGCLWKWNSSRHHVVRLSVQNVFVATLHIASLPFQVGQVCSQVRCRWSLRRVQVTTFYLFTFKVSSKCTWVMYTYKFWCVATGYYWFSSIKIPSQELTRKLELSWCSLSKGFLVTFLGSWDDRSCSWRREEILRKLSTDC